MDFYEIMERTPKQGHREVYPEFIIKRSKDLMIRGKDFYAVWNPEKGMWSQDAYDIREIIDQDLRAYRSKMTTDDAVHVKYAGLMSSSTWLNFVKYVKNLPDNFHELDETLTFADTKVVKSDYVSKRLPYSLTDGPCQAFEEIISTLYDPPEMEKIEWCIGSIVSGDSRDIQKFAVFYGDPGSGKGTILKIVEKLFPGYCTSFSAKDLTSSSNSFATEALRSHPLVAIDADAKLDRIEDNTKMNTVVSHENMLMNEKFKASYTSKLNCFLMLGSNEPVKITNAKSGIIRRLIDISPSGRTIKKRRYLELMDQIDFELGMIAKHCLDIFEEKGKHFYDGYKPLNMMYKTDEFFNFVEDSYPIFSKEEGISLKNAYAMYKQYCDDSGATFKLQRYKFREELKNYFSHFDNQTRVNGEQVRSWYSGFIKEKFMATQPDASPPPDPSPPSWLIFDKKESLLDEMLAECPAQYASEKDIPSMAWDNVKTKLKDLDTRRTHYVMPLDIPLITVDFDLKNEQGKKDRKLNLEAASKWPETYGEYSKGGEGIHLEYLYTGDTSRIKALYSPGIEIKVFTGKSSLRRRLSYCNDIPVATISSGLPLKEEKVVNFTGIENDKHLIALIEKALRKEIEPGATKTCIDFIEKVLDDAYKQGLHYDVTAYRPKVIAFANSSSHQAAYCLSRVSKMKFSSEEPSAPSMNHDDDRLAFFDVEVFPNLFLVNWKFAGDGTCQRMINPGPAEIESLLRLKLVGFNCRRYDNHILYARYLGKTLQELYDISQKIVNGSKNAMFGEAYNLSYTDVYDFCSTKQSLKKWEIELGFHHQELGLPWDQPVPEELWTKVAEYCDNDVLATEAVFNARQADWTARQILADIAGMSVNDTTNSLTTKIIFGDNKHPQSAFNYRNMGDVGAIVETTDDPYTAFDGEGRPIFPGYRYENGKSLYRGEDVGSGGYVYAEPGVYTNVALLDIASMHPSSIVAEHLFGDAYTRRFKDILEARIFIKHHEYDKAGALFDGKLAPYLVDDSMAKALAGALKIAINSVYGLTSATFENPFRDIRNIDNIVAKRGALFMVNLKHEVQKRGFTVAHIKTDSIKIPGATLDIIKFVMDYGKMYGYNFEHEATYDRMCLVNDAVYIARYSNDERNEHPGQWTATGTQFQVPYVFKTLFSKEDIQFEDLCETKTVTSALYLDMNEGLMNVSELEKEYQKLMKQEVVNLDDKERLETLIAQGHNYIFVGKAGLFCPVKPGCGGGLLMREKDGKYHAATGTKGYRWKEAEVIRKTHSEDDIDRGYFDALCDEAKKAIEEYMDFEIFTSETIQEKPKRDIPPWCMPCGESKYETCMDCPHWEPVDGECSVDESYSCTMNEQKGE